MFRARLVMAMGLCLLSSRFFLPTVSQADETLSPTNIVIVLADDLGYGDLACYGNKTIHSPNLDRFATEGMRLTHCYSAAPNCSPSRAGLMTGRTPYRVGIHNWIPMFSPMHLRKREITLATLLRQAGYATCHVGKWHLNGRFNMVGQPQPADHGFDWWFSTQNNALPCHRNPDNFVRNGKPVGRLEGYSAHLVVDEAIRWLREHRDPEKPFFLFVCFHEPHEPIATDEKYMRLYPSEDPSYARHHGNITQMDDAFGRLMRALDEMGLRDTTFVLFTSDNGPAITRWHPHGSAGPLRDKKGSLYEGGIRVPGIVRWPGHTRPGSVSDEPVCGVDVLPTVCQIVGIPQPADRVIDGTSIVPVLEGRPLQRKRPLYWQFNRAHSRPKVAIRAAEWKLLAALDGPELKRSASITAEEMRLLKTAGLTGFELYNLREDEAESRDRAEADPKRLARMVQTMRVIYREVQQESPVWPEWEFARYEAERLRPYWEELREIQNKARRR